MKVALVHELLTIKGGAERTLRILGDMFPEAPIFTLMYDEQKLGDWFPKDRVIVGLPGKTNHHLHLKTFPSIVEHWKFDEFDLVISSSSAFVHGIITNGKPKHLCYVNSPARYLWDRAHEVSKRAHKGFFGFIRGMYWDHLAHHLRIWDAEVAPRPDMLLAASKEVQRRIQLYWRRESDVVSPPLSKTWTSVQIRNPKSETKEKYFLVVSTLARYKNIDLAILACNAADVPLKIVGEGVDKSRLEKLAGPKTEFVGYTDHDALAEIYTNAEATLFVGEEDFGLVPLESMACGTPVIALKTGGALETVIEGKTGMFFTESTPQSLTEVIQKFDRSAFDPEVCKTHAQGFSEERFKQQIQEHVERVMVSGDEP